MKFRYHKNKLAETGGYDRLCLLNKKRFLQFHGIDTFPDATMTITDFKHMCVIKTGVAEKLRSDTTRYFVVVIHANWGWSTYLLKNMTDDKKSLTLNHLLLSGTRTTKKVGQ